MDPPPLSAFRSVSWNKGSKKWQAAIHKNGKSSHLGYFDDEEEAAQMYDLAAAALGRPLNFPKDEGEACAVKRRGLSKIPDKGKSAFTGVSWNKGSKKWKAQIQKDGKRSHLGSLDDEEEAARKYDEAAASLGLPIQKDGKKAHLGYFDDEEEAARKYDEVAATLGRPDGP